MFYDLKKILKNLLKFWYFYAITIIIMIVGIFVTTKKEYTKEVFINPIFLESNEIEYYEWGQNQIMSKVVFNQSKIKNNIEKEVQNIQIYIEKTKMQDITCLKILIKSSEKDLCNNDVLELIKNEITTLFNDSLKNDYINTMLTVKFELFLNHDFSNKNYNGLILKLGILGLFLEIFVIGLLGFLKDKVTYKEELSDKYSIDVIDLRNNDNSLLSLFANNEKIKYQILYLSGTCSIPNYQGCQNINDDHTQQQLLTSDMIFICIKLNSTSEKEVVKTLEFLRLLNKNNIKFIVQ